MPFTSILAMNSYLIKTALGLGYFWPSSRAIKVNLICGRVMTSHYMYRLSGGEGIGTVMWLSNILLDQQSKRKWDCLYHVQALICSVIGSVYDNIVVVFCTSLTFNHLKLAPTQAIQFLSNHSTFQTPNPKPHLSFYKPTPSLIFQLTPPGAQYCAPSQLYLLCLMNNSKENEQCILSIKTVTWQKDSHSLFDYQFNKNVVQATFDYDLTPKYLYMFRNNSNCQITFEASAQLEYKVSNHLQLLGCLQLKSDNKRHRIEFFNSSFIKEKNGNFSQRTNSSNSPTQPKKEDDIYLIVRSLKNKNNENKGYKLKNGQVVKLGRVEYLITSANANEQGENKAKFWSITKKIVVGEDSAVDLAKEECKYCYMGQTEEPDGFLCSPCKCSGSCGLVHFRCLEKWNQSKVKKEVVGGTIQYNFQKFYCQVCKDQYPRYIEKNNVEYELLPIDKPKGDHIILQGISEKANNMMVIQNVSSQGIKLGRGHDCEIRVTDISVSRNHAKIEKIGSQYFVFDNKSKFGTLVRQEHLEIQLSRIKQGIQIGRTVMTFQKVKKA